MEFIDLKFQENKFSSKIGPMKPNQSIGKNGNFPNWLVRFDWANFWQKKFFFLEILDQKLLEISKIAFKILG